MRLELGLVHGCEAEDSAQVLHDQFLQHDRADEMRRAGLHLSPVVPTHERLLNMRQRFCPNVVHRFPTIGADNDTRKFVLLSVFAVTPFAIADALNVFPCISINNRLVCTLENVVFLQWNFDLSLILVGFPLRLTQHGIANILPVLQNSVYRFSIPRIWIFRAGF